MRYICDCGSQEFKLVPRQKDGRKKGGGKALECVKCGDRTDKRGKPFKTINA